MIKLNGESIEQYEDKPLAELLSDRNYEFTKIAVECNGAIIPKSKYDTTLICPNDVIEVVTFVGGG